MTVKGSTAGRERYYRRNIALGDRAPGAELTVSSSVPGVPPGVWQGQAAQALGLSGIVSEAQMRALFGLGMHPDAEAIAARELGEGASLKRAMKAAKLGPAVPPLTELSQLDKEIEQVLQHAGEQLCRPLTKAETKDLRMRTAARAFQDEYHRAPADGAELGRFLAARTGPQRRALTGYDLTFSNEELSLLFALGSPAPHLPRGPGPGTLGDPGVAGAPCARGAHRAGRGGSAAGRIRAAGHGLSPLRIMRRRSHAA
ncbi:relaxase domain-containing protein [Streptomyces werraensis]|uniref:relaxase domain-containing protein n=1 Tax=Streptomyces werraensis TaxID=68284 RepID=UPI00381D9624